MPTNYRISDLFSSKIQNPRTQLPSKQPLIVKLRNLMPMKGLSSLKVKNGPVSEINETYTTHHPLCIVTENISKKLI